MHVYWRWSSGVNFQVCELLLDRVHIFDLVLFILSCFKIGCLIRYELAEKVAVKVSGGRIWVDPLRWINDAVLLRMDVLSLGRHHLS
jgi:hypothetical protein